MKGAIVFGAGVVAFLFGALAYDLKHPSEAEAGGGGIGLTCGTGTGGAVCTASPTLTGTLTGDRLTLTSTSGTALTATGQGTGKGGVFTGGGTDGGGNNGTPGVQGTGGAAGGNGVYGVGTGVYAGVWAEQTGNGRALVVSGDTTSPQKAQMYMIPTDSDPSGANLVGDLYMYTTGVLRSCVTAGTGSAAVFRSVANSGIRATVAAAGSVQSDATAINGLSDFYQATGADGTKGIALNVGTANQCTRIMNQSASVLKVWPNNADNDQINALGTDLAYSQAAGTSLIYCTADGTNWLTY